MISQESAAFSEPHILVTGAAGLVGEELVKQLLEKRFRVRALYHYKPLQIEHPLLQTVAGDLLDVVQLEELMEGITHVYHCAAIVSFDPAEKYRMLKINVEGTANVVNACIDAGIQKLVYVSSVAALGRIRKNEVIDEKANWSEETNNSVYGRSKHLAELEVWRGVAEGLNAVIVNPTIILGGNDWHTGSAAIFKTAWQQFKWYTEGVTGFVDVMDVARAMILLMQSDISAQRFILNSENLTYREVFTEIAECFKRRPPYKKVSPLMAAIVWRLEAIKSHFTARKHLLTRETARTAQAKVYFDNSKILESLPGFHFTPVKETIQRTCSVMQQKYQLK